MSRLVLGFMANALAASTSLRWFNPWNGGRATTGDGGATDKLPIVVPVDGTLKNFRIGALTSPAAASGTTTYTLVKNGVDTGVVIVINLTAAHTASDTVSTVSVVAGDYLTLKQQCSVSPTTPGVHIAFTFELEASGNQRLLHWGCDTPIATAGTRYVPQYFAGATPGTNERAILIPRDGTIDRLYIKGTTGSIASLHTYTVRKNAGNTSLTAALNDDASPYTASDLSNSFSVVRGDLVALQMITAGASSTASRIAAAVRYTPT